MAKTKEKKLREPFRIKKEIPLLPGYIMCIAWVVFTIMLVGWVMLASLSTSRTERMASPTRTSTSCVQFDR